MYEKFNIKKYMIFLWKIITKFNFNNYCNYEQEISVLQALIETAELLDSQSILIITAWRVNLVLILERKLEIWNKDYLENTHIFNNVNIKN